MNDVKRPPKKVKRKIRRSNIALDEYMFDRKMQSLYYGAKPKSDDLPALLKFFRNAYRRFKKEFKALPRTIPHMFGVLKVSARKHPARYLAGLLIFFIVFSFAWVLLGRRTTRTPAAQPLGSRTTDGSGNKIPLNQTPEFIVLLPQGKTAEQLGGFAKVSPYGAPAAYAFKDKINDVNILVTEQLLPETMKVETSKEVEKLAIGYNANQAVKTEKVEFFIGTNTNGQQSVISYNKTLLILIKSTNKISNERWQTYIEDLK